MPSEDTPVNLRSSIEAYQWRRNEIEKAVVPIIHGPLMRPPLFSENELSTLPYRRQNEPFAETRSRWPSSNGSSTRNVPFVKTSREIERGLLQKEIRLLEKENQDIKQRAQYNQRLMLKINKALCGVNMERL